MVVVVVLLQAVVVILLFLFFFLLLWWWLSGIGVIAVVVAVGVCFFLCLAADAQAAHKLALLKRGQLKPLQRTQGPARPSKFPIQI